MAEVSGAVKTFGCGSQIGRLLPVVYWDSTQMERRTLARAVTRALERVGAVMIIKITELDDFLNIVLEISKKGNNRLSQLSQQQQLRAAVEARGLPGSI